MKKIVFILILVNTCFISFSTAQETETKPTEYTKSRFYAGVYIAPTYLSSPHYKYFYYGVAREMDGMIGTGVHGGYNFNRKIALQAGFEYFNHEYKKDNIFQSLPSDTGMYYKAVYDVNYFQLPININVFLNKPNQKLQWYLPLGIVYKYQDITENISSYNSQNIYKSEKKTSLNEKYFFTSFGFGAQYLLTDKFSFFISPVARVGFWHKDETGTINNNLYGISYGINIGANYNF